MVLYIADRINETVNLADISKAIWGDAFKEESLRNIISSLRRKIADKKLNIITIKNVGYRLEEN